MLPLLFVVAFLFLGACGREQKDFLREIRSEETDIEADAAGEATVNAGETEETQPSSIYVDVSGAVKEPGVYELPEGSRVFQAIEAAGGLTEDAAPEAVNRAESVVDGQQIRIPDREELLFPGDGSFGGVLPAQAGKIDLNAATLDELCTLPGIGETKAETILSYRKKIGRFSSIEELMDVPGIKEATFERIKDHVTV